MINDVSLCGELWHVQSCKSNQLWQLLESKFVSSIPLSHDTSRS